MGYPWRVAVSSIQLFFVIIRTRATFHPRARGRNVDMWGVSYFITLHNVRSPGP